MSAPDFQIVSPNTHIEKRQILKNISNCWLYMDVCWSILSILLYLEMFYDKKKKI